MLPKTTEEVAAALRICNELCVPIVRGAGTSLAEGALPTADYVVVGYYRMTEVLEADYDNRYIRVQTGRTNLASSDMIE